MKFARREPGEIIPYREALVAGARYNLCRTRTNWLSGSSPVPQNIADT